VALAVTIRLARQLVGRDPQRAAALLEELVQRAEEATQTLRSLARGIYPPRLRESGLVAALRAHAGGAGPGVTFAADPAVEPLRFAPAVETGLYFACLEALQNAAKHAPGARAELRLSYDGERLCVRVRDEGPGFGPDAVADGSGLSGMRDRLEALGGSLHVASAPGAGTTVTCCVPAAPLEAAAPAAQRATAQAAERPARPALAHSAASASGPNSALER
jgi:signal transduction histidine kinase